MTLKLKRKSEHVGNGNITSTMGYYPKHGQMRDTEPALKTKHQPKRL